MREKYSARLLEGQRSATSSTEPSSLPKTAARAQAAIEEPDVRLPAVTHRGALVAKLFAKVAEMPVGLVDLGGDAGPVVFGEEGVDAEQFADAWSAPDKPGAHTLFSTVGGRKTPIGAAVSAPLALSGREGWVAAITPGDGTIAPHHTALISVFAELAADAHSQREANALWVDRLRTDAALHEAMHQLSGAGTLTCDLLAGERVQASTKALQILRRRTIDTVRDLLAAFVPHDRLALRRALTCATHDEPIVLDCEVDHPRRDAVSVRLKVSFLSADGEVTGWIASVEDTTLERRHIAELKRLAERDALTGVYSRDCLPRLVNQVVASARSQRDYAGLLLVTIDQFDSLTHHFGHAAGDAILKFVARVLTKLVRSSDHIVRMSGDHFAVVLSGVSEEEGVQRRAESIRDALATRVDTGQETVDISTSIGYAIFPTDTAAELDLYGAALIAVSEAMDSAPSAVRRYDAATLRRHKEERQFIAEVRRGLDNGEFVPFFQPKVNLESGRIVGFEALCRWCHPTRGVLTPGAFFSALASPVVGSDLSNVALKGSFLAARALKQLGLEFGQIAINISPLQLAKPDFHQMVFAMQSEHGVTSKQITFEVLETVLIKEKNAAHDNLRALADAGFTISLDDFGTGFASLSHIREPFIREVKIDRSFVMKCTSSGHDQQIVAAVVHMARRLGLTMVAEGIENEETLRKLRMLGCEVGQGFVFAPALPFDEAAEFLGRQNRIFSILGSIDSDPEPRSTLDSPEYQNGSPEPR